jgi:phosphoenolpyruvate carboxylase
MVKLETQLRKDLAALREQGKVITSVNPVAVLADRLSQDLDSGAVGIATVAGCLKNLARKAVRDRAAGLAGTIGVDPDRPLDSQRKAVCRAAMKGRRNWSFAAVLTGHPVFALTADQSDAVGRLALDPKAKAPELAPSAGITLEEEHGRAMAALGNAREAVGWLNRGLLEAARKTDPLGWKGTKLAPLTVASWVGYDMDGRDDIHWTDSFLFRLREKAEAMDTYAGRLAAALDVHDHEASDGPLHDLAAKLKTESEATHADCTRFAGLKTGAVGLAQAANALTERQAKLVDSAALADKLQALAKASENDPLAMECLLLAQDIASYGFGAGEIHFRLNALQVRNAMRSVDGRAVSQSRGGDSTRLLMERLNKRILNQSGQPVNFANLDAERTTAGRLMMLAAQILKHIDLAIPIRLLVAECERPLTLLSALYLARKYGVEDKLDISPLFETQTGLERGADTIAQLARVESYAAYVRRRGRLAVQTGFSDAGRFIGQITASLAIERLHIKLAQVMAAHLSGDVEIVIFNTHGESFGRGGARGSIANRQAYVFSPEARQRFVAASVQVRHETSFQGGDGYLFFQNQGLARHTILRLFETEITPPDAEPDPLYQQSDFGLDIFLNIKSWHDRLFANPDYSHLLDAFGTNLLPKTGSRPSQRSFTSAGGRRDPSKIRAIPHNAVLQQLGYLANVMGGLGHAAMIDLDSFTGLYDSSPRIRTLVDHAVRAKALGSLNTMLGYARLMDGGFWISRAYHGESRSNIRACRSLADVLSGDVRADAIERLVWIFRDDLLDLYRLCHRLGYGELRPGAGDRISMDSLHVIRQALMIHILILICRVPRFAEHNVTTREDLIRMALMMDIDSVVEIIEAEFSLGNRAARSTDLTEAGAGQPQVEDYQAIETTILNPVRDAHALIVKVSCAIGCLYGAHG